MPGKIESSGLQWTSLPQIRLVHTYFEYIKTLKGKQNDYESIDIKNKIYYGIFSI